MRTIVNPRFWLALSLVILGVVWRVAPHPWNFTPVGAIALFAGAHFDRRSFGIAIPLIAMLAGDAMIGFHSLMPVIYATYALIAVLGMVLARHRRSPAAVGGSAIAASTIFYVVTNFAVWVASPLYPKTAAGLIACYVAAIPFFGNTIASDLIFTAILFGVFATFERRVPLFAPTCG